MSDIVNESKQFIIIKPSSITEQSPSGLVYQLVMTAILNI